MHVSELFQKSKYDWIQDEDGQVISFTLCFRPAKMKLSKKLLKQEMENKWKYESALFYIFSLTEISRWPHLLQKRDTRLLHSIMSLIERWNLNSYFLLFLLRGGGYFLASLCFLLCFSIVMLTYEDQVNLEYDELHIHSINTPTHLVVELHMVLD